MPAPIWVSSSELRARPLHSPPRVVPRTKAVPQADTAGLAVKLDQMMQQVDNIPLLIAETPPTSRIMKVRADESTVPRAVRDFWEEMKGLVRIRELDTPEPQLLAPQQAYFLRENLKLRLLAARVSLLARDESTFRDDLKASQAWIP